MYYLIYKCIFRENIAYFSYSNVIQAVNEKNLLISVNELRENSVK